MKRLSIALRIERGLTVDSRARKRYGPQTIFLDGVYNGAPFCDNEARHYSLDHHAGCVRAFTLATCEQAAVMLLQGLPLFGEGLIYPFNEDQIAVEPFPIPDHYRRICGLDQGMEHATALTWIAYDPDNDVVYVYDVWKQSNTSIDDRVGAWRDRGSWIPVAWPHDVGNRDAGVTGRPFADLYREKGMLMLARSARIDPETGGRQPREPIIARVYERMAKGRFKVFRNLRQWFSEQQRYHRKDGQVVDRDDDLMSATHYAVMELRHARPRYRAEHELPPRAVGVDYDPLNPIS